MATLYDLFEASVAKNEANVALVWKDSDVSYIKYGLLRECAIKICEFLSEIDQEGCFVGILMDRVPLLCSVVLGVLKKRLAFAFIDDKSSCQRNLSFVRKLNIRWIISTSDVSQTRLLKYARLNKSITLCGSTIYLWDIGSEAIINQPKLHNKFSYAYAVQTSGTTGKPKIVKVPHRCVIPNILDFGHILHVQTSDVVLLGTSLTFDPSVVELFLALANGASLALPTAYEMATIVQTTPSLMRTLYNWKMMPKLRCLVLGGEPCPSPSILAQCLNLLPSRPAVFSAYGITEVSCWASLQRVELDAEEAMAVPLGKPLSETLMEVRDEQGNILTVGEGHMYIGSSHRVCLVNNELEKDLPAVVFRPTGDIVKVGPDHLFYMGRHDRMTKRWGRRLDLLLIETTATRLTSGAICCAVLVDSSLILAVSECVDCSQLRKNLMDVLPVDHVPDVVVELKKFPLTRHGKVDVPSVQSCVVSLVHSEQDFRKKTSERTLKTLWSELLNVEPSSGGFLEEGGSSILALQLFSLLELRLGRHPPASLLPALLTGRGATFRECVDILDNADSISGVSLEDKLPVSNLHQHSLSVNAAASRITGENSETLSTGSLIVPTVSCNQEQSTNSTDVTVEYQIIENKSYSKNLIADPDSRRIYGSNIPDVIKMHHDGHSQGFENNCKADTKKYCSVKQYSEMLHGEKILQKKEETKITQECPGKTVDCACSSLVPKMPQTSKRKDVVDEGQCTNSETVFQDNRNIQSVKRRATTQYSERGGLESAQLFKSNEEREFIERQNRQLTENLSTVCVKGVEQNILWCSENCSLDFAKDCVLHSHCQGRTENYSAVEPYTCHCKVYSGINPSLKWKLYLNKCIDSSPCIALYKSQHWLAIVGSHSGQLATIHDDGKVHSVLQLGGRIEAPACISPCGQQAYIGCYDGNIYAVDITQGSLIWVFSAGDKVKSGPVLCCHQTAIVVGCYNHKLYCIKVQDGTSLWSCELSRGGICGSPCVNSHIGLIFAGTLDGTIAAVEETSGQVVWQRHLSAPIFSSPVTFHQPDYSVVVVAEVLGIVHCYGASKGDELWTFQAGGNVFSSLCFFESACMPEDNSGLCLLFGCHDHKVYCLGTNGQLLWTTKLDSPVYATPFPFSTVNSEVDFVAAASTSGALCILHAKSGELLYKKNIGCELFSSPVVCGGVLVIGSRDDYLYCYKLTDA
ncbi:beta-alanine-activating enzyme isoform X1 [Schistocerca piceifrons]|uniref:beta-alanine-activating enzyme isoform X1 n=1 Tax=Schistocerca piceifrons TaxID=274613 RepID=UPI001F5E62CF|nr:beta-alanine-activating enzyme isoform X1 [Schistocerca piceifrons]